MPPSAPSSGWPCRITVEVRADKRGSIRGHRAADPVTPGLSDQHGAKSWFSPPSQRRNPETQKSLGVSSLPPPLALLQTSGRPPKSRKSACSGGGDRLGGSKIKAFLSRDDGRRKMRSAQLLHPTAGNREDLAADPGRGR